MSVFKGLYIKELKLSRSNFFAGIILLFLAAVLGLGLNSYMNTPSALALISLVILGLHIFYIPAMLLSSLNVEGKSQLWLHNPNSSTKLILAKIGAGFTYFLLSIIASFLIARFAINDLSVLLGVDLFHGQALKYLILLTFICLMGSLYLSVWLFFYWTIYHAIKNIPSIKKVRWLILLGIWVFLTWLQNVIVNSSLYQSLKEIGNINVPYFNHLFTSEVLMVETQINVVTTILSLIVIGVVFLASVWLLERKVEV